MEHVEYNNFRSALTAALVVLGFTLSARGAEQTAPSAEHRTPPAPPSVRLYVFDCGTLHIADLGRFQLKKEEVVTSDVSVACFLVAHPKGTLLWDPGAVPDTAWQPTGRTVTHHIRLPDSQERDVDITRPLTQQLAEVGYSPSDITYLALEVFAIGV
jgi:N-acyl homoserine lactone hydrolase